MPYLSIDAATQMYYELTGQGEPVVLISGHRGDHGSWSAVVPTLAHHFQVLTFDNLAAGQTRDDGQPISIERMAEAAWSLILALKLKRPTIVGESMGGMIAQTLAHLHGESIGKLVIINSMMKINAATLMNLEAQIALRQANLPFDLAFPLRLPWVFSSTFLSDSNRVQAFRAKVLSHPQPLSIENQIRQLEAVKAFNSHSWIKHIKVPTLVVSAKEDIVVLPHEVEALAEGIPHAQWVKIPGGHASPVEVPQELASAMKQFLCQE